MVAGDDHDLGAGGQTPADRLEHGPGGRERVAHRAVAQFDHVAEEHQAVDVVHGPDQRLERLLPAQHVLPRGRAEVKIGDDQGAQRETLR